MANLSQQKREKLLAFIESLREQHKDDASLTALNELENALNEKKYGLVWEQHCEKVDEMLEDNIPVFTEVEDRKITANPDAPYNFLLEGDNLHSLKLLEKTHAGKIDVIYIDPPYNTGNKDFKYNDSYVDKTDGYSHSKWLSFMNERLGIAKKLLRDEGVIFISIDDNEQAQLKLLCDEVFGEDNFISKLVIESGEVFGTKAAHVTSTFVKVKDYVLVYCLNKEKIDKKQPLYDAMNELFDSHYNTIILHNSLKKMTLLQYLKRQEEDLLKCNVNLEKLSLNNISNLLKDNAEFRKYFYEEISNILYTDQPFKGKISDVDIESLPIGRIFKYEDKLLFKTNSGSIRMLQSFSNCLNITDDYFPTYCRSSFRGDLWKNFHIDMRNIDDEGGIKFKSGKKPIRMVKQLFKWFNKRNALILDFFAGSGTTGQTVIQLNKEDGGTRRYILCTNNENNICEEVTYQRLKNIQEELPHNLKYYRTDFVPKFSEDELVEEELLGYIIELIELQYGHDIDNKHMFLVTNEDELDEVLTEDAAEGIKVFITSDILLTSKQEILCEQKQIEVISIPEYYYRNELIEVGEI